jgi:hypothetical protein
MPLFQADQVAFGAGGPVIVTQTLAETLALGNTTGGNDIIISAGDEITDLVANGLTYPTADGMPGYVMSTDGAGTLTFVDVSTLITLPGLNYLGTFDPASPLVNAPDGLTAPADGAEPPYAPGDVFVVAVSGIWNFVTGDQTIDGNEITLDVGEKMYYNPDGTWEVVGNVDQVSSVFGRTGAVVAEDSDYDADQIDYDDTVTMFGGGVADVQAAIEALAGQVTGDTFIVKAARRANNTTNVYLRHPDGLPTNVTPVTLPFDCTLIAMTGTTEVAETWSGEIHISLSLVAGALVSPAAATQAIATMAIDFSAGDAIQLYCNGTGVRNPVIQAFFRRR